jgi:hypothetical protein
VLQGAAIFQAAFQRRDFARERIEEEYQVVSCGVAT